MINSLHFIGLTHADFTFIYSKFLAPLPSTINEFRSSLLLVFPHVLDVNHLMKEIGPVEKVNNLPASISYLRRKFFAPIDMEVSHRGKYLCVSYLIIYKLYIYALPSKCIYP